MTKQSKSSPEMLTRSESNRLHLVPVGNLVRCRVKSHFNLGAGQSVTPGEVIDVTPNRAAEYAYNEWVDVLSSGGNFITSPDPAYVAPSPPATATIRIRIPSNHHPIGEPGPRHCAVGEVIEVLETVAVYACSGGNPAAERVA